MTIAAGQPWGETRRLPTDVRIVPGGPELHRWIVGHRVSGEPITDVAVGDGDLRRTCGRSTPVTSGAETLRVPIDILHVVLDPGGEHERTTWAAEWIVARRSWWRGEVLLAMNAEFYGRYDVAPRAHPNDGRVDTVLVDASMSIRQRLAARRRAVHGAHLPHPKLHTSRGRQLDLSFSRRLVIWADGVRIGTAQRLVITVEADAMHLDL